MQIKNDDIILVTRADDMGYTHTGNLATIDCLRNGILRSASILVVAPWFEEAVKLSKENPDLCFGVHLGIIGEWRGYRWRPVLPYSEIRTLVDEDGFLWGSPADFWAHNPDMKQLDREFRAQIDLAKKKGVVVDFIDTHYHMPYDPRLRPMLEQMGKDYKVPVSALLGEVPLDDFGVYTLPPEEKEKALAQILREMQPGIHLLIGHPGYPSLENDVLVHYEPKDVMPLGVGRLRASETLAYTSPRIKRLVEERGIKLVSYREFCSPNKAA
jgi:hypothetical protein